MGCTSLFLFEFDTSFFPKALRQIIKRDIAFVETVVQIETEVSEAFCSRLSVNLSPHELWVFIMNNHDRNRQHEEKGCVCGSVRSLCLDLLNIAHLHIQDRFFYNGKSLFLSASSFCSVHIPTT